MKFVDEALIKVVAGKGGDGCLSFRREKYIPLGGPDGGDGGDGGSVFVRGCKSLNTLADFRTQRTYKGQNGQPGQGKDKFGKGGDDLTIDVPIGTQIFDTEIDELLGDITEIGQILKVAQGGFHGLGNPRFKSSTNRGPRKTTPGSEGERRELRLELKVLADVGLLGMPNAGKSTLIRAVSAAKPKVAGYPFTTLYPNLGVVNVGTHRSFVIADIPGLIEGAAEGLGLGIQFLKHLSRTGVLLHVLDVAPYDGEDPVITAKLILKELEKYDSELLNKPRWLVLNKVDLLAEDEREAVCSDIVQELNWQGPVYSLSAISKSGTEPLCYDLMAYIESKQEDDDASKLKQEDDDASKLKQEDDDASKLKHEDNDAS